MLPNHKLLKINGNEHYYNNGVQIEIGINDFWNILIFIGQNNIIHAYWIVNKVQCSTTPLERLCKMTDYTLSQRKYSFKEKV